MSRQADQKRTAEFVRSPLAAIAASFALGIVLARPGHASLPGVPLLLGCGLCLLIGVIALASGMRATPFLLALVGFVGTGAVASRLFQFRFPPNHVSNLEQQGFD